ncbi:MAG: heme exporter protein CcmD [Pseudomonadota bacterium]
MTGPYAAFVISAYGIAFGAIGGIIVWAILDRRAARAAQARAERAVARASEAQ